MGLQISSLTLDNGIALTNVYARINSINGNKDQLTYNLNYYVSRDDDKAGKSYVKQSQIYTFVPLTVTDSVRWDKQAYDNAKTQAEFAEASDVLED